MMINNKRGLSGVIVTLITVLLAIVAIGIVWVVISGVLEGNRGSIDVATMCQGAIISIDGAINTTDSLCTVTVKRLPGINQETISGIDVSVDDGTSKPEVTEIEMGATISNVECEGTPTTARARVYLMVESEKKYCPAVTWAA